MVLVGASGVTFLRNNTLSRLKEQEFCHSRCVFFQQNRGTIGFTCAQAVTLLYDDPVM
jgi:hypothetical protein